MAHRIVITGAPASGKTKMFDRLSSDERFQAFAFLPELARQLLIENPGFRTDREAFHREIYRRQVAREEALAGRSFVTDRGTVDAFAFHPETAGLVNTSISREYNRYDAVIHLGSAAGLGPDFYRTDAVRRETIDEALEIEEAIRSVWSDHPGYHFLPASENYEQKYRDFAALISNLAGITEELNNPGGRSSV